MFYLNGNAPFIQKDPEIQKLCEDVWSKLKEIGADEPCVVPNNISFVSYEDALKELLKMKKEGIY